MMSQNRSKMSFLNHFKDLKLLDAIDTEAIVMKPETNLRLKFICQNSAT